MGEISTLKTISTNEFRSAGLVTYMLMNCFLLSPTTLKNMCINAVGFKHRKRGVLGKWQRKGR